MPDTPVSRLDLELLLLGELPPEQADALQAAAEHDPDLAARIERLSRELAAASTDLPPLQLTDETLARPDVTAALPPTPVPVNRPRWWSAALVAAAALLVTVALPALFPEESGLQTTFRGSFDLEVVQERLGRAWEGGALLEARSGDRVELRVTPSTDGWLMVYDAEDDGDVSTFQAPRPVQAQQPVTITVRLDDHDGAERIFVLFHEAPVPEDIFAEELLHEHRTPLVDLDRLPHLPGAQRSVLITRDPP